MPSNLRSTAARTSVIQRKNLFKSPQKNKSPIKKILPTQAKYKQGLQKKLFTNDHESQLTIEDYNVELDYQLSRKENIVTAVETIVENQWSESSTMHTKYSSNEDVKTKTMEQLVFQLKGLSMNSKADVMKYRSNQLPPGLVTCNQLYSIFEKEGHTFVDRNIELAIRRGQIRKFVITNAAPIIETLHTKNNKITYGYENVEVIVKTDSYNQILGGINANSSQLLPLTKFKKFTKENPSSLFVGVSDGFDEEDLTKLVKMGLITLTSNYLNEIESQQYALAFPNCGTFLKLINNGRSWLVKTLSKSKYKELLEADLFNKWEGIDPNGNSKMTNFRKPFYGYDLNWILADALGSGIIEVFNTPVGRGWKLTGKR